jgi:hypothetical protein
MSDVSDNASNKNNSIKDNFYNMESDKRTDQNIIVDDNVFEVLKLNPMIGYKKPFFYCKECPKVQNINREEIERHILYSKDHQSR